MASSTTPTFYTIAQHKPVVQLILSFLSNRDVFALFSVSARLRRMWYIQYEKLRNSKPFEMRAKQVQLAREWRKALDLQRRVLCLTGKEFDIFRCDPMERFRDLVKKGVRPKAAVKREREDHMEMLFEMAKKSMYE